MLNGWFACRGSRRLESERWGEDNGLHLMENNGMSGMNMQNVSDDLVWHYTTSAGFQGIVSNHEIWASHSRHLNDPDEGGFLLESFLAEVREGLSRVGRKDAVDDWMHIKYLNLSGPGGLFRPDPFYFLTCGTSLEDSLLMWRDYARERVSYAIGFDPNVRFSAKEPHADLRYAPSPEEFEWQKVEYVDSRTELPQPVSDEIQAACRDAVPRGVDPEEFDWMEIHFKLLAILEEFSARYKHAAYRVEEESRLIVRSDSPNAWDFRSGQYGLTAHVRLESSRHQKWGMRLKGSKVNFLPIRSVILSPNATDADVEMAEALLYANGYRSYNIDETVLLPSGEEAEWPMMHSEYVVRVRRSDARMRP